MTVQDAFAEYVGQRVVLDTDSSYVYIGCLTSADEFFITLDEADVMDVSRSQINKDMYLMEAGRDGVTNNRGQVKVKQSAVLSLSRLEDIRVF